jgi:His/Glu/Gln/Arg/opine family amino acid ABC transporter permease subunit
MIIDFQLIIESLPKLLSGVLVTLQIAGFGCLIGFIGGTILALMQTSGNTLLRWLVNGYVVVIRGTPMLIHILCAFYVLPQLGIRLDILSTAIIAIGLNSAAYISQVIRSGISSVGKGQIEAAKVLGFSSFDTARYIILPQALRVVLPALGSEFITLVKDSALASTIGVAELSKQGKLIISTTYDGITIFFAITLIYLMITSTISFIFSCLEKRMSYHVKG